MSSGFGVAYPTDFTKHCVLGGLNIFIWRTSEQSETTMIFFQISNFFSEKVKHNMQASQKLLLIYVMM